MGRKKKTVEAPEPEPEPERGRGRDPEDAGEVEQVFRMFADTIPAEASVSCTLKRLPSYVHPAVRSAEDLPPPAELGSFEEIKAEIRERYGPGKYKLWVRYHDGKTGKRSMIAPTFLLAPTPEEEAAFVAEARPDVAGRVPPKDDRIRDSLDRLRGAIETKAQAAELSALERAAAGPATSSTSDAMLTMRALADVVKSVMPQQSDPLTLLRNAKELISPPAASGDSAGQLAIVREAIGLIRDLGGEAASGGRRAGVWETLITETFGLLKETGPALLGFLQAYAASRGPEAPAPTGTQGTLSAPPTGGRLNHAKILEAVGGDQRRALALATALNTALLEVTTPYDMAEDRLDGALSVVEFIEAHCPGLAEQLRALTSEQLPAWFFALDGRLTQEPTARAWIGVFRNALVPGTPTPRTVDDLQEHA